MSFCSSLLNDPSVWSCNLSTVVAHLLIKENCIYTLMPAVLLVDDNFVQATTRKAVLVASGHEVIVAYSAASALRSLGSAEFIDSLGLLITDHLMPVMNGPEFIRAVREIAPTLPVLVVSGMADAESEYDGLDVMFRAKPFAPEELVELVQFLLDERTRLRA